MLCSAGIDIIDADPDDSGRIDLTDALRRLGERGLTRLLVEGGGALAASLLRAGLVDRLVWLHAPLLLGGDGVPAIAGLGFDALAAAPRFERLTTEAAGADLMTTYRVLQPAAASHGGPVPHE
jgi:diaminohydroxyphosphoribosylaminopyrimidine deaminase/5-amino-6-(5-phosphoribosylamino)uracil reductase